MASDPETQRASCLLHCHYNLVTGYSRAFLNEVEDNIDKDGPVEDAQACDQQSNSCQIDETWPEQSFFQGYRSIVPAGVHSHGPYKENVAISKFISSCLHLITWNVALLVRPPRRSERHSHTFLSYLSLIWCHNVKFESDTVEYVHEGKCIPGKCHLKTAAALWDAGLCFLSITPNPKRNKSFTLDMQHISLEVLG